MEKKPRVHISAPAHAGSIAMANITLWNHYDHQLLYMYNEAKNGVSVRFSGEQNPEPTER